MRKYSWVLLGALLLLGACSPIRENEPQSRFAPQINPFEQQGAVRYENAVLYYPVAKEGYLAGWEIQLAFPQNEQREATQIKALLEDPPLNMGLSHLFWPGVRLVDLKGEGDMVSVILSQELLDPPPMEVAGRHKVYMGIQAIVATLTQSGTYERAQVLVAQNNSREGRRLTRAQAGFEGGEDTLLEPMRQDLNLLMNPQTLAKCFLEQAMRRDAEQIHLLLEPQGAPDKSHINERLHAAKALVIGFRLGEIWQRDENHVVLSVDITYQRPDETNYVRYEQSLTMLCVQGVWRVSPQGVLALIAPDQDVDTAQGGQRP